jgi:hypothetical protein
MCVKKNQPKHLERTMLLAYAWNEPESGENSNRKDPTYVQESPADKAAKQSVLSLPRRADALAEAAFPKRAGPLSFEFVACQPHAESPTHLIFSFEYQVEHRNDAIRQVAEPLGHQVEHVGLSTTVAPDGYEFQGDIVTIQPPIGLSTLLKISQALPASFGIANGYFENNPDMS